MAVKRYTRAMLKYLSDPDYRFLMNASSGKYDSMPDKEYLQRKFKSSIGKHLNIDNPQTFNEKLQWLKLYDHDPKYTMMVDKYKVRDYIEDQLGKEYLIPLIGVWDDPDDIDFNKLPDQFVLKCNHNSGLGMCICKDKSKLDIKKTKAELRKGLKQDYYLTGREWPYKNVPRKIVAEKYMVDEKYKELVDYKFYCFDGKPEFLYIATANIKNGCKNDLMSFLDTEWNLLPFYRKDHQPFPFDMEKPEKLKDMLCIAKKLSKGIPFVRVDLYCINSCIFFSEFTFFPGSGFGKFSPEIWDEKIGSYIRI